MTPSKSQQAWAPDQLIKSQFFHQKLHGWKLLEVAEAIESVQGERVEWILDDLSISQDAWNRVIHRGIKPVRVFAHLAILTTISRSVAYYRMLAMVSQKSMKRVGLDADRYENGWALPGVERAQDIARTLNRIISALVEADEEINAREFDLWRGMAAGSQAQGSWQNSKGSRIEIVIKGLVQRQLRESEAVLQETADGLRMDLRDGRRVIYADEPDIGIYREHILSAVSGLQQQRAVGDASPQRDVGHVGEAPVHFRQCVARAGAPPGEREGSRVSLWEASERQARWPCLTVLLGFARLG